MKKTETELPLLPLRDVVVFPDMVVPLFVGRDSSLRALEAAMANKGHRWIALVTQRDSEIEEPKAEDLHTVGVRATLIQFLKLPDGTVKVLLECGPRIHLNIIQVSASHSSVNYSRMTEICMDDTESHALMRAVIERFDQYARINKNISQELSESLEYIADASRLADTVAAHLPVAVQEKQAILEMLSSKDRLEYVLVKIEEQIDLSKAERKIHGRVKDQMEKNQRDYYLNEQIKAIQKELGDKEESREDLDELTEAIVSAGMPDDVKKKAESELKKLSMMPPVSSESTVVRNYLDWLVTLPWKKKTRLMHDLTQAEKILEEDHYGLEKLKERVLEQLAVQKRVKKIKGPILCLVGPPGVGKTSLGQSIARASGRKYVRIALGGLRDEAEIRGHRRTYIGSMPGKIIQAMKRAGTRNPLILLDEIDKLGSDFRGDPSSALLEVLDPEQNCAFNDHYLDVDYDLSDVMFITTANRLNIPMPLRDRMEVIQMSGYTEQEKIHIAKRYLVPRQMASHGLKDKEFLLSETALLDVLHYYTREAGVRNLEREIAKLTRKATRRLVVNKHEKSVRITTVNLEKHLGVRQYRYGLAEEKDQVGAATGLAWTEVGGELLTIEATLLEGKGKLTITGKLGDVMKESAQAAMTYARSHAVRWGVQSDFYQKQDVHIHVPEGATPKDGPSAGIAICTSVVSALTGISVRKDVAMTGEITLRGRVLPVGGLKEKLLAAHRASIFHVIIPQDNLKDLKEIPVAILNDVEIHVVSRVDEVLSLALVETPNRDQRDRPTAPPGKSPQSVAQPKTPSAPAPVSGQLPVAH